MTTQHGRWHLGQETEGESPLSAALRGISALEQHRVRPKELVFSHAMLNRYMDAIATAVNHEGRMQLQYLLEDPSISESARSGTIIKILKEFGIKDFKTHDNAVNRQANGGVTEYTVNRSSGLWIAGRRIEPSKAGSEHAYIEYKRNAKVGKWERVTSGEVSKDNE